MNSIIDIVDFRFVQSGRVFIIETDKVGVFRHFVAVDELTVQYALMSEYKVQILNSKGEVIVQNFRNFDLKAVQELLTDVETEFGKREQLLEEIDKALDNGNRELFMELTEKLKQMDIGGLVNDGVA